MTKDELLKLVTVLQAELEATNRQVEILSDVLAESRREVAAINQARSAPVQEPEPACWQGEDGCPNRQACCDAQHCLYTTPPAAPVQEPVAVIGSGFQLLYCREDWAKGLKIGDTLCLCTPPAAQRQWVGLTDEEIYATSKETHFAQKPVAAFARAIEAKLKEKNNG